jgi:hypothetical protein
MVKPLPTEPLTDEDADIKFTNCSGSLTVVGPEANCLCAYQQIADCRDAELMLKAQTIRHVDNGIAYGTIAEISLWNMPFGGYQP